MVLTLAFVGSAMAAKGGQIKYATGPFSYDPALAGSANFLGSYGGPTSGSFTVTAPSGGSLFPSGAGSALADIKVFGVEKVADANGDPLLEPVNIPLSSALGAQIAGAFLINGSSVYPVLFENPGFPFPVNLSVSNPMVVEADYGVYVITIKAQAPGSGIGVGSGSRFNLTLQPAELVDTTAPDVTIDAPSGANILGVIAVIIKATDPEPGTGVASMTASVSSTGGAVNNQSVSLTTDTPKAAGEIATATGTFTPTGGTGTAGTTLALAFHDTNLSGIGSYTLTAKAVDGAGNEGINTSGFQVNYDVQFTETFANLIETGRDKVYSTNSFGSFKFTVDRSDSTFMFDQTVTVILVRSDNQAVATHYYGTGAVSNDVQINSTDNGYVYETKFVSKDFGATAKATYKAEVWFKNVDGALVKQAESAAIEF